MNFLLDTNICIGLLNGRDPSFLQQLQLLNPQDVYLCSIVKAELIYGARKSQQKDKNEKRLKIFFQEFQSVSFDDRCAEVYGDIRSHLEKSGKLIGNNDILIAATAIVYEFHLVTQNVREFERIFSLPLIQW